MTEPRYRILFALILLISLYYHWQFLIYLQILVLIIEAYTNRFIAERYDSWRQQTTVKRQIEVTQHTIRIDFEADRITRFAIAVLLLISVGLFPQALWFLPWFIGFNIALAGLFNYCPTTMLFQKLGLR